MRVQVVNKIMSKMFLNLEIYLNCEELEDIFYFITFIHKEINNQKCIKYKNMLNKVKHKIIDVRKDILDFVKNIIQINLYRNKTNLDLKIELLNYLTNFMKFIFEINEFINELFSIYFEETMASNELIYSFLYKIIYRELNIPIHTLPDQLEIKINVTKIIDKYEQNNIFDKLNYFQEYLKILEKKILE